MIDLLLFVILLLFFPVIIWASVEKQNARLHRLRMEADKKKRQTLRR